MITPEEATELLDIFDAADRWVAEYNTWCNPADFGEGYSEHLNRTNYRIYRWRQRLNHIIYTTPADAGDNQ